jgi:DNA repair protein RecO (recombination protein O)
MNVGESDRLVTLFTSDYGIIKAFASGAKNIKSKKGAATSLLTYSSFTIKRKKDSFRIYEATPISVFFGAGKDIEVLALSQYFCELANVFALEGTPNKELLRLILNSLHFLTKEKRFPPLIKAITELRTAVISGYSPNLVACEECGKFDEDIMYFQFLDGDLRCQNCEKQGEMAPVDRTILTAMRHIVYSEFQKLYSFTIPDDKAKILSDITGKYITVQTDHKFSTLAFYESIKE